ncbi:MAG: exosome complex RNA-binding protein Csl4 [Thermoplasmataceae archaeon]
MVQENMKIVFPGEVLSSAEEYLPGVNTIEMDGFVKSLAFGYLMKDDSRMIVFVKTEKVRLKPRIGAITYGQVIKVDQRQAIIKIGGYYDEKNGLTSFTGEGYIRFGQGDRGRPSTIPIIKAGDYLRGKVLRLGQNFELGIMGRNLGVVKARCGRCREFLVLESGSLYCNNCERTEQRKYTEDYGNIVSFGDDVEDRKL